MATPGGLGFPHAAQAVRITLILVGGNTTRETAYLTVTLPAANTPPEQLDHRAHREWHIKDRLH